MHYVQLWLEQLRSALGPQVFEGAILSFKFWLEDGSHCIPYFIVRYIIILKKLLGYLKVSF